MTTLARPTTIVTLFLACVWLSMAFATRAAYLDEISDRTVPVVHSFCAGGAGTRTPDSICLRSPDLTYALLESYGARGRSFYTATQLTLDAVFPIAYGLLFIGALAWVVPRGFGIRPLTERLRLVLPILAVIADYSENLTTVGLIQLFPRRVPVLAWVSAGATLLKFVALVLVALLLIVAMIRWAHRPDA
jgi:hypothetical protein